MERVILLDMDGVLVNWADEVAQWFSVSSKELQGAWNPGEYQIHKVLSRILARDAGQIKDGIVREIVRHGADWWAGLHPYPWAGKIINACTDFVGRENVYFCSNPAFTSQHVSIGPVMEGKMRWLERHTKKDCRKFVFTPHKHLLARKGTILIDDHGPTLVEFERAGGSFIPCPAKYNNWHHAADDPADFIVRMLDDLKHMEGGFNV